MDTSHEYTKMCEKAEEIQKDKKNLWLGDFYFDINDLNDVQILDISALTGGFVWLPRQDQLQEMSRHHKEGWFDTRESNNLCIFFEWWRSNMVKFGDDVTMEQLWLSFVMETKFNKEWVNKEWKLISK
jgi:hypothetical protein